jgi:hypothetical protein
MKVHEFWSFAALCALASSAPASSTRAAMRLTAAMARKLRSGRDGCGVGAASAAWRTQHRPPVTPWPLHPPRPLHKARPACATLQLHTPMLFLLAKKRSPRQAVRRSRLSPSSATAPTRLPILPARRQPLTTCTAGPITRPPPPRRPATLATAAPCAAAPPAAPARRPCWAAARATRRGSRAAAQPRPEPGPRAANLPAVAAVRRPAPSSGTGT